MAITCGGGTAILRGLERQRLGSLRRQLLLASEHGPYRVSEGSRSDRHGEVRRDAARDLERLGLVTITKKPGVASEGRWHWHLLYIEATELGRLVLDTYRDELRSGGRVRWSKLEGARAA